MFLTYKKLDVFLFLQWAPENSELFNIRHYKPRKYSSILPIILYNVLKTSIFAIFMSRDTKKVLIAEVKPKSQGITTL